MENRKGQHLARYTFIVLLVVLLVGPGYLGYYLAYIGLTADGSKQTDLAALREALANAAEQADRSNEMNTLQRQLVEKSTELSAAMADLGKTRERLEDTVADLNASQALLSQTNRKVAALESSLSERNAQVERLTASLVRLQSQYDDAHAEIAELTEKLTDMSSVDSSPPEMETAVPEPEVVPVDKPELPLEVDSRKALFSGKFRITVRNAGDVDLTVNAAVSGPDANGLSPRELVIPAGQTLRLGVRDDWVLRSGQSLTLQHADYEPRVYLIP